MIMDGQHNNNYVTVYEPPSIQQLPINYHHSHYYDYYHPCPCNNNARLMLVANNIYYPHYSLCL